MASKKKWISVSILILVPFFAFSQEKRISPLNVSSVRYKDTYLKIVYSQPLKKGRDIFGGLVPFGKVWRTGANEATELTVTNDILVNGQELKAGTYSLFTIPNQESWTIIFNKDLGLWGAYNYNPTQDAMRFDVPVAGTDTSYEAFTIQIDPLNNQVDISMRWDKTMVTFSVLCQEPKLKP